MVRARVGFELVLLAAFAYATVEAGSFPSLARTFPRVIAAAGVVLAAVSLTWDLYRAFAGKPVISHELLDRTPSAEDEESRPATRAIERLRYPLWFVAYPLAIALLGAPGATLVFTGAFLRCEGGMGWRKSALAAVIATALLVLLSNTMGLAWPLPLWQ